MTVERACGCGAVLAVDGDVLYCPACGCRAQAWLVALDGEVVGAADRDGVVLGPVLAALAGGAIPLS